MTDRILIPSAAVAELYDEPNGFQLGDWTRVREQHISFTTSQEHLRLVLAHTDGTYWSINFVRGIASSWDHEFPWDGADDDTDQLSLTRVYPHTVSTVEFRESAPDTLTS